MTGAHASRNVIGDEPSGSLRVPRLALVLMLGLAACVASDSGLPDDPGDAQGWRFASGKRPTRAEYVAVVAACKEGPVKRKAAPLESCLADLGMKRAP
jgi:hypothetical protein